MLSVWFDGQHGYLLNWYIQRNKKYSDKKQMLYSHFSISFYNNKYKMAPYPLVLSILQS